MNITHTTSQPINAPRIKVINIELETTGDELADLKTAGAIARNENPSASWIGNDYAKTGKLATFSYEVR